MVEKAVVVGVGLLAYPFMRTPQSSETGDGNARHNKTAPAALQQQQGINSDVGSTESEPTTLARADSRPATVVNLAARLADVSDKHVSAVTVSSSLPQTALDDLNSLATPVVNPLYHQQQPVAGVASSAVPVSTLAAVLPAEPPMAMGQAAFQRTRSLRDTYGSIPTAAADRAAQDAAIAAALAAQAPSAGAAAESGGAVGQEAGAPSTQANGLQSMPSIPEAAGEAPSPGMFDTLADDCTVSTA